MSKPEPLVQETKVPQDTKPYSVTGDAEPLNDSGLRSTVFSVISGSNKEKLVVKAAKAPRELGHLHREAYIYDRLQGSEAETHIPRFYGLFRTVAEDSPMTILLLQDVGTALVQQNVSALSELPLERRLGEPD